MVEISKEDIRECYYKIEHMNSDELYHVIFSNNPEALRYYTRKDECDDTCAWIAAESAPLYNDVVEMVNAFLRKERIDVINLFKAHRKRTSFLLRMIEILAPAFANEYGGFTTMIIVATLYLLLQEYIKTFTESELDL